MTDKQKLAVKAVLYGCASNKALGIDNGGVYFNREMKAHIGWQEALDTVYEMLEGEENDG